MCCNWDSVFFIDRNRLYHGGGSTPNTMGPVDPSRMNSIASWMDDLEYLGVSMRIHPDLCFGVEQIRCRTKGVLAVMSYKLHIGDVLGKASRKWKGQTGIIEFALKAGRAANSPRKMVVAL
jgi:hypothetical protein